MASHLSGIVLVTRRTTVISNIDSVSISDSKKERNPNFSGIEPNLVFKTLLIRRTNANSRAGNYARINHRPKRDRFSAFRGRKERCQEGTCDRNLVRRANAV